MRYHLVLERPHHGPRFLGSFSSREEADAYRARLIIDHAWGRFVRIVTGTQARPTIRSNGAP
jgi:hypothetical protein